MKFVVASLLLASLPVFTHSLSANTRQVELRNGVLTLYAGEYQATFSYGHRWNLSGLSYADVPVIPPGGANQFNVKMRNSSEGSSWYGGIGQPEDVEQVTFYIDGTPHELPPAEAGKNRVFVDGGRFSIEKISRIGPYQVTLRTSVDAEGVSEELSFSGAEATENVDFLYPSRFSFSSGFTRWFATLSDGFEEEGDFGKAGSTVINRVTTHLALFDPESQHVALLSTLEEAPQEEGSHFIWNSESPRLHFHSKIPAVRDTDGSITIRRHLSVWPVGGGDWQEQARAKMQ